MYKPLYVFAKIRAAAVTSCPLHLTECAKAGRQAGGQAGRQADRQAGRQAGSRKFRTII